MASERVEWVRRQVELYNAGDLDAFLDALGPEFSFSPDPSFPDADTYSGEDFRRWMGEWNRMWEEHELEMLETTELEATVIATWRWHLSAAGTGQRIPVQDFHVVVWFDGNRARRAAAYFDEERALAAAAEPPG